jgi:hypothetical protein
MARVWFAFALLLLLAIPSAVPAQPVETEIPGVTAELLELRQHEGVLRLAVRFVNTAPKEVPSGTAAIQFADVTLVDLDGRTKYSAAKGPDGRFLAGPMSDDDTGGRWWIALPAKSEAILWMLFAPLPGGSVVSVQMPHMFPLENVRVTEGPSEVFSSTTARSTPTGANATLVSAVRTKTGDVRVRLRIERVPGAFAGPAVLYRDAMLLRLAEKETYSVLQDTSGNFVAQPITDQGDGGRFWLHTLAVGRTALMSLTFSGPPDPVSTADLLIPWFVPMMGIKIVNEAMPKAPGASRP